MTHFKNFIALAVFCVTVTTAAAQQNIKPGDNLTNSNIDRFVGKWASDDKNIHTVLNFLKENVPVGSIKMDMLLGFHQITNDKKVLSANFSDNAKFASNVKSASFAGQGDKTNPNVVNGYMALDSSSIRYKIKLVLSDDGRAITMTATPKETEILDLDSRKTGVPLAKTIVLRRLK